MVSLLVTQHYTIHYRISLKQFCLTLVYIFVDVTVGKQDWSECMETHRNQLRFKKFLTASELERQTSLIIYPNTIYHAGNVPNVSLFVDS
jgi:hypothetical protein